MIIQLLYFGVLTQVMNKNTDSVEVSDNIAIQDLINLLTTDNPALKKYKFQTALNKQIVSPETVINAGDTIAFLPPFSGG